MFELIVEPPIAAVFVNIVRMRGGAEAMCVEPPEKPRRRGWRSAPGRVHERRPIFSKTARKQTRESGSEHIFPKINPRGRPPREQAVQHLLQDFGSAIAFVGDHPKKGEQTPFVEARDRQATKGTQAAPERIKAQVYAVCAHGDDFALEKSLRAFGKRSEEVGDDRLRVGQGGSKLERRAHRGQADCAGRSHSLV